MRQITGFKRPRRWLPLAGALLLVCGGSTPADCSPLIFGIDSVGSMSFLGGLGNTPVFTGLHVEVITGPFLSLGCVPACDVLMDFGPLLSFVVVPGFYDEWIFDSGSFLIQAVGGEFVDVNGNTSYDPGLDITGTLASGTIGQVDLYDIGGSFKFASPPQLAGVTLPAALASAISYSAGPLTGTLFLPFSGTVTGPACSAPNCGAFASSSMKGGVIALVTPEPASGILSGVLLLAMLLRRNWRKSIL